MFAIRVNFAILKIGSLSLLNRLFFLSFPVLSLTQGSFSVFPFLGLLKKGWALWAAHNILPYNINFNTNTLHIR